MTTYAVQPQDQAEFEQLIGEYYNNMDVAFAQLKLNHPDRYGSGQITPTAPTQPTTPTAQPSWWEQTLKTIETYYNPGKAGAAQGAASQGVTDPNANGGTWFGIDKRYVSMAFLGSAIVAILLLIAALSEISIESALEAVHGN